MDDNLSTEEHQKVNVEVHKLELLDAIRELSVTSSRLSRRTMFLGWGCVAVAVIGLAFAALGIVRQVSASQPTFEQKLRCKKMADDYNAEQQKRSDESLDRAVWVWDTFERVDFSASRNSCIIEHERITRFESRSRDSYLVTDLVSGQTLFEQSCSEDEHSNNYCGNGRNIALKKSQDGAFERALTHSKMK